MNDDVMMREHLSALADGELQGEEFARTMAYAGTEDGQSTWRIYHMIGDAMRNTEMPQAADAALLGKLRAQLALEPRPDGVAPAAPLARVASPSSDAAANASVFRWKLAAGFASLAAVAAIGWNAYLGQGGVAASQMPQLAAVQPQGALPASTFLATTGGQGGQQVMIRDPRLDELLAAHKQFGSTSALQMPAGFLRNATFEAPKR